MSSLEGNGTTKVEKPPFKHRRIIYALMWLVGLAVYATVIWLVGWHNIRDQLFAMDLRFFAVVILMETAGVWVRVVKWPYVLGRGQNAIGLYFISKGAGHLSPGRLGELSPLLFKKHRSSRMGAWILADRLVDSATTIVFGVLGLAFLPLAYNALAIPAGFLLVLLMGGGFFLLTQHGTFMRLSARLPSGSRRRRLADIAAAVSKAFRDFRSKMPLVLLLSAVALVCELIGALFLYKSFGYSVGIPAVAAARCANGLVGAFPITPAPTGMPHAAAGVVMHEAAGIPWDTLATALPLHMAATLCVFWTSFGVGMLDMRRGRQAPESSTERDAGLP